MATKEVTDAIAKLTAEKEFALKELKEKDRTIIRLTIENYNLKNPPSVKKRKFRDDKSEDIEDEVREFLHGRTYPLAPPSSVRDLMRIDADKYYEEYDMVNPKTFQDEVLRAMYFHPQSRLEWRDFVIEHIGRDKKNEWCAALTMPWKRVAVKNVLICQKKIKSNLK